MFKYFNATELNKNFSIKTLILTLLVQLLFYGSFAFILSIVGFEWKRAMVYHNWVAFFPLYGVVFGEITGAIIRLIQERRS